MSSLKEVYPITKPEPSRRPISPLLEQARPLSLMPGKLSFPQFRSSTDCPECAYNGSLGKLTPSRSTYTGGEEYGKGSSWPHPGRGLKNVRFPGARPNFCKTSRLELRAPPYLGEAASNFSLPSSQDGAGTFPGGTSTKWAEHQPPEMSTRLSPSAGTQDHTRLISPATLNGSGLLI